MQHWVLLLCLNFSMRVVPKLEYLRCLERIQYIWYELHYVRLKLIPYLSKHILVTRGLHCGSEIKVKQM